MSVYSVKPKGWRYDFTLKGKRYTEAWFKTKQEAKQAEARKREELSNPATTWAQETPTGMGFLAFINARLDHVKAYHSERHYSELVYMARRWVKLWGNLRCEELSPPVVEKFILQRRKVSAYTANKEIRYLRATFNFGIKKKLIAVNPLDGIIFFPVEKRIKYVPSSADIDKVIALAGPEEQDYLWTIRETMARMSEVNRLTWEDVNLDSRYVVLYTRKKRGGHLTPRRIPMTCKLFEVFSRRFQERDQSKPWVFWHRYWSSKENAWKEAPFWDRKKFMRTLCEKAGVKYFRFHALRHAGASIMENGNVSIGTIQKILGHENRTTTEIYLHSLGDADRLAMLAYEQARLNSHTESHTQQKRG
ncbi:MAG: site-specific integrase [Desulfobulbaceae bacterium]|nr:site-specific integrase [Desulfobulbaceae bacterium]